jgi:predicted SprT family Zn-dependent metalloprotease
MNLTAARILARALMDGHDLQHWHFQWDSARKRYGQCQFATRTISMSKILTPHREPEDVAQTMLHEIAHALVGPSYGHDRTWLAKAREIGYTGGRCSNDAAAQVVAQQSPYVATCDRCDLALARFKRPAAGARYTHPADGGTVTFSRRAT